MIKIELQKLINNWKKEVADLNRHNETEYDQCLFFQNNGSFMRLRKCITEAELLLKHDESKQPQPPDFANTMLGEVPHVVNAQSEESLKAVEGATPVVRQNEQTKEVCDFHGVFTNITDDGKRLCAQCGEPL